MLLFNRIEKERKQDASDDEVRRKLCFHRQRIRNAYYREERGYFTRTRKEVAEFSGEPFENELDTFEHVEHGRLVDFKNEHDLHAILVRGESSLETWKITSIKTHNNTTRTWKFSCCDESGTTRMLTYPSLSVSESESSVVVFKGLPRLDARRAGESEVHYLSTRVQVLEGEVEKRKRDNETLVVESREHKRLASGCVGCGITCTAETSVFCAECEGIECKNCVLRSLVREPCAYPVCAGCGVTFPENAVRVERDLVDANRALSERPANNALLDKVSSISSDWKDALIRAILTHDGKCEEF